MELSQGAQAPHFTCNFSDGATKSLSDFKGKNVVLYFYPKDDTPGCTKQACGFRDLFQDFKAKNTVIIGVSPDGLASHEKFKTKYELPFFLAPDEDKAICQAYDVWKEKNMYGKKTMGVVRSTFLIDANGIIQRVWRNVKVDGHMEAVLHAVDDVA